MYKAVLWDFGGVITSSPFEAFNRFEAANNIPADFIRKVNSTNPDNNAWAQLESSEISADAFDQAFADESARLGHEIRGRQVLALLSGELRDEMIRALDIIKSTYAIGCITNNVKSSESPATGPSGRFAEVMERFHVVIESSKVGMRKPDPRIYQMACEELNVAPEEAIFLDDLGINLKPARALGMTTIKVFDADQALTELEQHLGMSLR